MKSPRYVPSLEGRGRREGGKREERVRRAVVGEREGRGRGVDVGEREGREEGRVQYLRLW